MSRKNDDAVFVVEVEQRDDGIYMTGERGEWIAVPCQWFAMCDRQATTTEPHPVLGDVPICAKHSEWCREMSK